MSRFEVVESEEALEELPYRTVVQAAELDEEGEAWLNSYKYFEKFGGHEPWVEMDPTDRYDGEASVSNGVVWNTAHGFGTPQKGEVRVLFNPEWENDESTAESHGD